MTEAWFVGVDWGSKEHHVCLLDASGKVVGQRAFDHNGEGLSAMADWLLVRTGKPPSEVGVAIEVPHGPVVESLMERGFNVHSINPRQLDRFRDRFSVAGAKDDRRDARVLAAALRTDPECLRPLQAPDEITLQLRAWTRARKQLVEDRKRLSNQVRDLLWRYYPQLLEAVKNDVSANWAMALWRCVPTPAKALRVREETIAKLLKKHRIRRLTADQLLALLRQQSIDVGHGVVDAATSHIDTLMPVLKVVNRQIANIDQRLERMTRQMAEPLVLQQNDGSTTVEHTDAGILRSIPGVGTVVLATLLAEAHEPLRRRDPQALRCLAGAAPVTKRSGKKLIVVRRLAANDRLADAAHHWARVAAQRDAISKTKCKRMRARGHRYGRALRQVSDRLIHVACAMLRDRKLFDPHRAAARSRPRPEAS